MGKVSMCVLVVFFSTRDRSCGVCRLGTRFVWLCMYIIETNSMRVQC